MSARVSLTTAMLANPDSSKSNKHAALAVYKQPTLTWPRHIYAQFHCLSHLKPLEQHVGFAWCAHCQWMADSEQSALCICRKQLFLSDSRPTSSATRTRRNVIANHLI